MLSIVILAAGFGTRMKSQTPKVLHTLCGKSMIEYVIDESLKISSDIHIILFNQKEKIISYLKNKYQYYIIDKITFHVQLHDIYPGTGGAFMQENKELIPIKEDKVLVLSADSPMICADSLLPLLQSESAINIATFKTRNPSGYGRIIKEDNTNHVIRIIEEKDCTHTHKKIDEVNGGIYCFNKTILQHYIPLLLNDNAQKEYYLTDVINLFARDSQAIHDKGKNCQGIMACELSEKELMGVNTKAHLAIAQNLMLERVRHRAMLQGVIMDIPESIYLDSSVEFEGECKLENGVRIVGKSKIQNSIIKAHSVIEESEIISSDIGPHAHIRPQCNIQDSHIGNFVECKKAMLKGVKAGHLSYLGDCEINTGSNIGAGVITCNYDGKSKHKTIIGKDVFVGSDCQLVAPVTIKDRVLIAAGSTITHDIPQGVLAIARGKQRNIENGFYKFFDEKE
ncbi:bifunctional UDP-N-acetylglucosamine diphosphorylase/glucosamine-1-phosphate N-acetyltransferase GlmU [Helicobacter didelphidarum]|uniref:Bifunctional protein GlmU n=1 Tax=Helicobacter didelphidarum TaxID=2040648 RepID=A0A3D8IRE1_9HELI|nr:bifunctional UDP-N-acetylglucosamine diphosphorylase/glucosamine-1-phosphate N-acetyltransferase GlmU [Helicobacter didelphidarum]RDU67496.1 bifunctional UDP-N-acetylglucosamine diphosphorylase/glucosamine-1-phosphate N-acetyltransferase GlmU [Helicobacter didelphidarum]